MKFAVDCLLLIPEVDCFIPQKSLQDFVNEVRERIDSKSALREQNVNAAGLDFIA
jgi:hypothetical protein